MKKVFLLLCIFLCCFRMAAEQAEQPDAEEEAGDYEPYSQDEFPSWLRELRRAEVVFIGSFPIAMLFTSLSYEGARAIIDAAKGTDTTGGSQLFGSERFTSEERRGILIAGALLSAAVAVADHIIGLSGGSDGE